MQKYKVKLCNVIIWSIAAYWVKVCIMTGRNIGSNIFNVLKRMQMIKLVCIISIADISNAKLIYIYYKIHKW